MQSSPAPISSSLNKFHSDLYVTSLRWSHKKL